MGDAAIRQRQYSLAFLLLTAMSAATAAAQQGGPPVRLVEPRPLAPKLEAFPRIVAPPTDHAVERINQALARGNARVRAAAKSCRETGGKNSSWTRTVSVTMAGPRYLSMIASDFWFCGGAHPGVGLLALVYDLSTGAPVNWARLLPAAMVQATETDTAGDGTVIGTVSSDVLAGLYRKSGKLDVQCGDAVATWSLTFQLWLDAKQGGIAMQPTGFPHVIAMCAVEVVIPTERLRRLGVKAELLDSIDSARRRIIGPDKD